MATPTRRSGRPAANNRKAPARRTAAPTRKTTKRDVTEYATKPATDYHKAFAKWIVTEVGFDPESATSKRAAFLRGVSIATAARPAFMESDFLEEWRDRTGTAKRGPKPKEEDEEATARGRRRRPEPESEAEEFDEDSDDDEDADDDDDFDDEDADDDDDFDDEDADDDDDFDEDDEEVEEAPPARRRGRPAASSKAPAKAAPARKAAPAKRAAPARGKAAAGKGRATKPAADDDDFIF